MNINKYSPAVIRKAFRFLVDEFHYSIALKIELFHEQRWYGYTIEYVGNDHWVHLAHDYKEEFFDFVVIWGLHTRYPTITIRKA